MSNSVSIAYTSASVNGELTWCKAFPHPLCVLPCKFCQVAILVEQSKRPWSVVRRDPFWLYVLFRIHSQRSYWKHLVWHIDLEAFSTCAFTAFLFLARDVPVSAVGSSGLPRVEEMNMLDSLPSAVFEILEKMEGLAVLDHSDFNIALDYMSHCHSCDVGWLPCTSSWPPWDFSKCEISDVPPGSAYSSCRFNTGGGPKGNCIVHAFPALFDAGDLM